MKPVPFIVAMALSVAISGCAAVDTPSRSFQFQASADDASAPIEGLDSPVFADAVPAYRVENINVVVPDTLVVSEENSYYPSGDIVWRGDPPGDRHDQIKVIFDDALGRGTSAMSGEVPVTLDIEVARFHALTEKTRYTFGGVHSIKFTLSVRDAETGLLLGEPRFIDADLKGFGGQRAINAELQGQTQKVRITDHLANVIQTELRQPNSPATSRLGFVDALN